MRNQVELANLESSVTKQEMSDSLTGQGGVKRSLKLDLKDAQSLKEPRETQPSVISANKVLVSKPSRTSTPEMGNARVSNTLSNGNTHFKVPSVSFRTPAVVEGGTHKTVKHHIQDRAQLETPDPHNKEFHAPLPLPAVHP